MRALAADSHRALAKALADLAPGLGFDADALFDEVRRAWSYRELGRDAFHWALDFVVRGGVSLGAYPEHHRVVVVNGVHSARRLAR